ncbi:hypothetical protein DFQ28_010346 [Apophysomyces sp. BC1034]|nr:hypothetical protein DFQ30_010028 [Apophysomyces sp. BC1015]KAG0171343.1 hypothetical protein DFQ29_008900 [Apophysomyces sp. BC1021]KAG0184845.1 hypothetical protein DFQ28_010346 [Apophysomyces sp. BC1034]
MKGLLYLALGALLGSNLAQAQTDFYGLNYGVNPDACPTVDSLKSDFSKLKQYTNRIKTFSLSACNQGDLALQATEELGMRMYLGMWIDRPDTFDQEMNALNNVLAKHNLSNVDGIVVGSEVLYRGDTDAASLVNYINKVKALVKPKGIKVTTADVYYKIPPEVVQAVDFVTMNAFPYWEGVTVDQGANTLMEHYQSVISIAQGKPVIIGETGWPSEGANFGASVPSPANQHTYLQQVLCRVKQQNINMLWFSAMDEPYRAGVEGHWGLLDSTRQLKTNIPPSVLKTPCQ